MGVFLCKIDQETIFSKNGMYVSTPIILGALQYLIQGFKEQRKK